MHSNSLEQGRDTDRHSNGQGDSGATTNSNLSFGEIKDNQRGHALFVTFYTDLIAVSSHLQKCSMGDSNTLVDDIAVLSFDGVIGDKCYK